MPSLSPFRKYLLTSGFVHTLVILFVAWGPLNTFQKPLFENKVTWVNLPLGAGDTLKAGLAQSADLPKTTVQEQEKVNPPAPVVKKKAPAVKLPPKTNKKEVKKLPPKKLSPEEQAREDMIAKVLARAKTDAAQQRATPSRVAPPEAAQIQDSSEGGVPFGNLSGQTVSRQDPEYLIYQARIRARIMKEWILPVTLQDSLLTCEVLVLINERGDVIEKTLKTRSGSEALDLSALRAIERATPLDIPPPRLQYEAFTEGFLIEFNSQKME